MKYKNWHYIRFAGIKLHIKGLTNKQMMSIYFEHLQHNEYRLTIPKKTKGNV